MLNANGKIFRNEQGIFPVIYCHKPTSTIKCLGTAFFIHELGIFVTARHVIADVAQDGAAGDSHIMLVQQLSDRQTVSRMVTNLCIHPSADIVVGLAGIARHIRTAEPVNFELAPKCRLSFKQIDNGTTLAGFGYPKTERIVNENLTTFNFRGNWSEGAVEDFHIGGTSMLKNSCYQTTMVIKSGSSGGPVFHNGHVVGINSSSFELTGEENPISFITPVGYLLPLQVPIEGELISVKDLIQKNIVVAEY